MTSVNEFKNVTILRDTVCAQILEWYAFESQRPNKIARQAIRKFASMGIRTWIQGITGWEANSEPLPLPVPTSPKTLDSGEIAETLARLKHDLKTALKHRHAIHNLVEQPTVVDLSLQQIVHTAVHVQAKKLNDALQQVSFLEEQLDLLTQARLPDRPDANPLPPAEWERLRQENDHLVKRLAFMQGRRSALSPSVVVAKMTIQQRIQDLTETLLTYQKRPNGDRAQQICRLQATIFARYEAGESLKDIASDLDLLYDTAKKYLKRTRTLLRLPSMSL